MFRQLARFLSLAVLVAASLVSSASFARLEETDRAVPLDLTGPWRFRLDPEKAGHGDLWFKVRLADQIKLPGTTDEAGYGSKSTGSDNGQLTRAFKYYGQAWYQRDIEIPPDWKGKHVSLLLERVMWRSEVWVDAEAKGMCDSLGTPHRFDLGELPTGLHTLTICVDSSEIHPVGTRGHCYSDSMQGIWNGILGRIELSATPPLHIERQRVFTRNDGTVRVEISVSGGGTTPARAVVTMRDSRSGQVVGKGKTSFTVSGVADKAYVDLKLDCAPSLWSEFNPALYTLETTLKVWGNTDSAETTFGFREVAHDGSRLLINGRPSFMRGNMDNVHFPLTGHPPTDVESWRRIFKTYKEYGLNQVRFHSWCPPEAAFQAADEEGIYVQPEILWIDSWMGTGPGLGKGYKTLDQYVRAEMRRIVDTYGNHPSFIFFTIGNELGNSDFNVTGQWIRDEKAYDSRRLYAASTARAITPWCDYSDTHNIPGGGQSVNRFGVGYTDWDFEGAYGRATVPIIAHELGQVPVYPRWSEIKKYTGTLRPRNLERLHALAITNGVAAQDKLFQAASGNMNRILYKEDIEAVLRSAHSSGFSLLGMTDYSGQGEALVGWLDSFYDSKGVVTPAQFCQYSAPTVPLARFGKYNWTTNETFSARIQLSHFGKYPIKDASAIWALKDMEAGITVASGAMGIPQVDVGQLADIGEIGTPLDAVKAPAHLKLTVAVEIPNVKSAINNEWDLWVFPADSGAMASTNVTVCSELTPERLEVLQQGGRVLLLANKLGRSGNCVPAGWRPVFWSTAWFGGSPDKTLGAVVREKHPALARFPTAGCFDWQWQPIASGGKAFILNNFPSCRPIVQPVSDFHVNYRLGSIFEVAVGKGKLLVCGYDLSGERLTNPAVRQLWNSLLSYASGNSFKPECRVEPEWVERMFCPVSVKTGGRPGEFKKAGIYIECAARLNRSGDVPWTKDLDHAELNEGSSYAVSGTTWRDEDGTYWVGKKLGFTLKTTVSDISRLLVRFRDPNHNGRTGSGTFEGRSFAVPAHADRPAGAYWLELRVEREDALDGVLKFEADAVTGPNLMIDRVVLMPK